MFITLGIIIGIGLVFLATRPGVTVHDQAVLLIGAAAEVVIGLILFLITKLDKR